MIRFICFLLGKSYESCKSCETLKIQLAIVNEEKKQLTEALLNIIQPKVTEAAPVEINQIQQSSALFSRRRAALEAKDREEAKILRGSTNLGRPDFVSDIEIPAKPNMDKIDELEKELGISEQNTKQNTEQEQGV